MAEDSVKEGSKEKLKFFKKAKGDSNDSAVTVAEGKENRKEEAPAAVEQEPKAEQSAVQADEARAEAKAEGPKPQLMPMLAPTLALAVRTLVILAIILADAYAAYFLVVKGIAPRMAEAQVVRAAQQADVVEEPAAETEEVHAGGKAGTGVGSITPIEDIVVNPAGSGGTRYLCTTVALESTEPVVADEVAEREPQIRDILIEILSERTVEDLSVLSARDELRAEIKTAVNNLLVSGEVVGVYLSNFVLQ
jgi:flagellar FliL protein